MYRLEWGGMGWISHLIVRADFNPSIPRHHSVRLNPSSSVAAASPGLAATIATGPLASSNAAIVVTLPGVSTPPTAAAMAHSITVHGSSIGGGGSNGPPSGRRGLLTSPRVRIHQMVSNSGTVTGDDGGPASPTPPAIAITSTTIAVTPSTTPVADSIITNHNSTITAIAAPPTNATIPLSVIGEDGSHHDEHDVPLLGPISVDSELGSSILSATGGIARAEGPASIARVEAEAAIELQERLAKVGSSARVTNPSTPLTQSAPYPQSQQQATAPPIHIRTATMTTTTATLGGGGGNNSSANDVGGGGGNNSGYNNTSDNNNLSASSNNPGSPTLPPSHGPAFSSAFNALAGTMSSSATLGSTNGSSSHHQRLLFRLRSLFHSALLDTARLVANNILFSFFVSRPFVEYAARHPRMGGASTNNNNNPATGGSTTTAQRKRRRRRRAAAAAQQQQQQQPQSNAVVGPRTVATGNFFPLVQIPPPQQPGAAIISGSSPTVATLSSSATTAPQLQPQLSIHVHGQSPRGPINLGTQSQAITLSLSPIGGAPGHTLTIPATLHVTKTNDDNLSSPTVYL
jgi:hypothetical protein